MANFTIYFSQYLKNHEVPSSLDRLPADENGKSFKQRFIERNYFKEIGSETEELFSMHLAIRCDEVVEDYGWRIKIFSENIDKLMDRYIPTHNVTVIANEGSDTSEGNNEHYYNPLNAQSGTLSDNDKVGSTLTYGKTTTETIDRQHAVSWARSNPEIMKEIMALEDVYETALKSLDTLFMAVL